MVKLLQSKSTKTVFVSHEGLGTPPNWGPPFGLNSLPRGPHSLKLQKKFPSAAKQRTVSVHSLAAGVRRIRVCIHLSVLQSPSSFTALSVVPLLSDHSLGPRLCLFYPSGLISESVSGNCTAISNSLAFTIIKFVLPTHSLLPSLKAAPSVALPLNPARVKVSTWLNVHIPTLITV